MTRILHISDLHIMPEGALFQGRIDTAAALREMLSGLERLLPAIGPVERLVISGDLTETGCAAAYAHLQKLMEQAPLPWLAIPGNHDSRAQLRRFANGARWMPDEGPVNWREDLAGVSLIGMDTLVEGSAHGEVMPETLGWLTATLRDLQDRPVLLFLHHPPIATGLAAMDAIGLAPNPELERLLRAYPGPLQVACGHVHRMITGCYAGRQVTIAPGTSHAMRLDLGAAAGFAFTQGLTGALLHDVSGPYRCLQIAAQDLG